jgi:hypothetical protein
LPDFIKDDFSCDSGNEYYSSIKKIWYDKPLITEFYYNNINNNNNINKLIEVRIMANNSIRYRNIGIE